MWVETTPGRSVNEAWVYLTPVEAQELSTDLQAWEAEDPPDPEWHTHIRDGQREVTIAVSAQVDTAEFAGRFTGQSSSEPAAQIATPGSPGEPAKLGDGSASRASVLIVMQSALVGNVTASLRAVAVAWRTDWIGARFIYDAPPDENTLELVDYAETLVLAQFNDRLVTSFETVELDDSAALEVNEGELWVYMRYEP